MNPRALFSVYWWDPDGTYYRESEFVPAEDAVRVAHRLANSVGGKLGTVKRIIITDGGDCCVWEWIYGQDIVWPEELKGPARPVVEK